MPCGINCYADGYRNRNSYLDEVDTFKDVVYVVISYGTRPSVQSVSDVCLKRVCSLDTNAFSASKVLDDCAI